MQQRVSLLTIATSVSIALLVDTSYSVLSGDKLSDLLGAGEALLATLKRGDTIALATFSKGVRLIVPSTRDVSTVRRALADLRTSVRKRRFDATAMWDAVFATASVVVGSGRPLVMLLSDGADNASWLFTNQPDDAKWMMTEKARTVDALRGSGVVVDVISVPRNFGMWTWDDGVYGPMSPDDPARLTGGAAFEAKQANLQQRLGERLELLRSAYVLTYTPTGVKHDDGWHKLTVRLKNRKGKVQARPGYFAGAVISKH